MSTGLIKRGTKMSTTVNAAAMTDMTQAMNATSREIVEAINEHVRSYWCAVQSDYQAQIAAKYNMTVDELINAWAKHVVEGMVK